MERGKVLVTATGMDTEMGRIAKMLSNTKSNETPLQKKLEKNRKAIRYWGIGCVCGDICDGDIATQTAIFYVYDSGKSRLWQQFRKVCLPL